MKPFYGSLKLSYLQDHQSPIKKGGREVGVWGISRDFFFCDEIG